MALAYAGITCELRELLLRDKPADMLKHSPKGTVPVLVTQTGQVIDESLEVMIWAVKQHDPDHWLHNKAQSLALIEQHDYEFKPLLDRYKYADRHPEKTPEQHRDATWEFIQGLDHRLVDQDYLVSADMTLADVALFPFIRQYAFVDINWFKHQPLPHLQKWLNSFLATDLFKRIMPKYKLYNDGFRYRFPAANDIDFDQMIA